MDENNQNLPLLPLTSGVVLPGMVFTMALESDEAKAAAEAAEAVGGQFVIVPFIDGRYASVGVVAEVVEQRRAARWDAGRGGARRRAGALGDGGARAPVGPCGSRSSGSPRSRRPTRPPSWPASTGRWWRTSCWAAAPAAWPSAWPR